MSLWTPGGEHEVPREPQNQPQPAPTGTTGSADEGAVEIDEAALAEMLGIPSLDELSDEERAQLEEAVIRMAETERQLATTPAEIVIANHAMGMYELAAIHLRQNPPNLAEASLAIDGLGSLLDGIQGRLGENEATLVQARAQLQQAYVAAKSGAPVEDA